MNVLKNQDDLKKQKVMTQKCTQPQNKDNLSNEEDLIFGNNL